MARKGKFKPKTLRADAKSSQALELRLRGLDYDTIAKQVGYADRATAWNAINRLLEQKAAQTAEDAERLRTLEVARLDKMLDAMWDDATGGDPRAVDRVVKIQERRAKLLGLDAPTKQELSGPDGEAIKIDARESLVSRIAGIIERSAEKRDSDKPE